MKAKKFLVMSHICLSIFNSEQISNMKYSEIIYSDLETIETNGGGSARCMFIRGFY